MYRVSAGTVNSWIFPILLEKKIVYMQLHGSRRQIYERRRIFSSIIILRDTMVKSGFLNGTIFLEITIILIVSTQIQ